MKVFQKQPADHLDYTIKLGNWLPEGDSISSVTSDIPTGIEETQTEIEGNEIRVWLQGGTAGETYKVEVLASTAAGRKKEVEFLIVVVEL